ncbi:protein let-653-like isoform X2 [Anopheles stephensi]|uniref:protein let-653-like isoform X2 n=1 Tax=Anopheles stephensi TaxID=30069 RepID=UPI001658BCB2|nr:protein let-653-like isoform X2 [Anopheles stephensi]
MDPKWLLIVICSLALNLTDGSSDADDSVSSNVTDTKQWRNLKLSGTTTASGARKVATTTRKMMSTKKKGPSMRTTKRAGQLVVAPTTTWKRPGQTQSSKSPTGRRTTRRTTARPTTKLPLRVKGGPEPRGMTTREPLRTMPPVPTPKGYTTVTTKARGVPEKIKQGSTTRRGQTTTTKRTIRTTEPVLPRIRQEVMLLSAPFSFFGQKLYTPSMAYGLFSDPDPTTTTATDSANSTTTTTADPTASNTTETSTVTTATVATVDNSTASNGTVEYEEVNETMPAPADYEYQEEDNATTARVAIVPSATETTVGGSSTMGPNMVRKRRKKVTITTTPSTNPGVVRIKLRRKITTIAPVTEGATENGA